MKTDLISVVVPVYNVEPYLNRCIKSIINQTYKNLEIILVDDGATDNSGVMCDEWQDRDKRIKVIHKVNGGLSDARNVGIKHATGTYITCIDSDDSIDLDMIEYLYKLLKNHKCRMSLCSHRVLFERSNKIKNLGNGQEEVLNAEECIKKMCYHDCVDTSAWGKLYERELFYNIEYPVGKLFEDIGTTYKTFMASERIACGYKDKYTYYVRPNSIVTGSFNIKKLDLLEMTDKMAEDVLKIFPNLEKAVLRRMVYARFSTLNQMIDSNYIDSNIKEFIKFIYDNQMTLLKDRNTPLRDKLAIVFLRVGIDFYKWCWKFYKRNL